MLKFGSKSDINVTYKCTVRLLEDTEVVECEFQTHHKGKFVVEYVCRQLNLIEKDYFGLRYVDSNKQRHWLDLAKTVMKQVKDMDPILFSFRVKFYPPDPFRLKEEITRYQIYLQLKRDLLHGRLYCTQEEASLLGAYVLQSEIGDYDPEEHVENYVSEFKLLLKQTILIEEKIVEIHSTQLKGQTPAEAETNFLRKAYLLDTYGVDPHPVKDHRGNQLYLGINHLGILTFQGSRKTHHFKWNEVQKINYEGKMFIVHLTFNEKKHTVGFKCPTGAACRHVWRCAVEQMLFFTLPSSSEAPSVVTGGSFFSWGTKFRYSGRVEREIMEDLGPLRREEPPINRSRPPSLRRKASSVPATPSTPVGSDIGEIRYSSLPRANHSAPLPDTRLDGSLLCGVDLPLSSPYCPDNTLPLLETVAEDQEINNKKGPAEEPNAIETHDSNVLAEHEKMDAHVDHTDFGLNQDANTEVEKRQDNKKIETEIIGNNLGAQPNNILSPTSEPSSEKGGIDGSHGIDSGGSHGSYSDYYFRDSFDHSSSESQLDVGTHKHASHRHDAYGQSQGTPTPLHLKSGSSKSTLQQRKFNLIHVFIPSFLFVVFALAILVIVVLESDSELLSSVRRMPEMVVLRKDYYEPMKEYLKQRLGKLL